MLAFHSDAHSLALPPGHRFPQSKYRLLREHFEREPGLVRMQPAPAATEGELALAHTPDYVDAVLNGTLGAAQQREIGFPWSPSMAERSRRSVGASIAAARAALAGRSVTLVGMMGAGKTSVGRRLAAALDLPFVDADSEIEAVADMTVSEIFAKFGEAYFRSGEQRVIARLLDGGQKVLATGGGAWMNAETRERIAAGGVSVWLKADVDVLLRRVRKRGGRPLLATPDPEGTLRRLVEERYPVYALADLTIASRDAPHEQTVADLLETLARLATGQRPETER